ncbi:MAG: cytochrome b/b6 domain-containing protein [Gammaproteobacteria bacterium]
MSSQHKPMPQQWDWATRFLHFGLAITVTLQLFNSLVIEKPEPGHPLSGFEAFMLDIHEWLGMAAFVIVLLHWAWSLWGLGGYGVRHLLPWDKQGYSEIVTSLRGLLKGKLPSGGPKDKLAGLIHGLGLIAVLGAAATGAVLFFFMPENGKLNSFTGIASQLHEFISTFVWIYWGGHTGMALLHHFVSHDQILPRMFSPSKK